MNSPASILHGHPYLNVLPETGWILHECTSMHEHDVRWTERHLQCIWFDDRLRPGLLRNQHDEPIRVIDPGRWNLEAGPDFLDAVITVGNHQRRICGDVEVHIRPADWAHHHHAADRRYDKVVLHLTFFPGATPGLPDSAHQTALREALMRRSTFTFEDIDVAAYPHETISASPRPCAEVLHDNIPLVETLLETAGAHRIEMKTARIRSKLHACPDRHRIFYEEVMAALGYKHNKAAFRNLAGKVSLRDARVGDALARYALLVGSAGLLPTTEFCRNKTARSFIRHLWDIFWQLGESPPNAAALTWRLDGVRPLNHPLRRLAAAAELFDDPSAVLNRIDALPCHTPRQWFSDCAACFRTDNQIEFWKRRVSLNAKPSKRTLSLLGKTRMAAIVTNVVVPFMLAEDRLPRKMIESLPAEQVSAPMRCTATRLLGRDHSPAVYNRSGLRQQGLLQIYQDFCLNTRKDCETCELPQKLAQGL